MFKVKYKIWIGLLILSFVINFAITNVPSIFEELFKEPIVAEMYIQSTENSKIKNQLLGMGTNTVSLKMANSINENTQVILTDKVDSNIDVNVYEKHSGVINSPIVLFSPRNASGEAENFSAGIGNSKSLTKDLYEILVAIEENKTWKDIGISDKVVSGNVSLVIPRKNSLYYPAVVETIYMTLNQNKDILSIDDVDTLKNRVDNIISKCVEVEDISRYISNKRKDNNKKLSSLVLGPEFIIIDDTDTYSYDDNDWMPIYLKITSSISLDLYIKQGPNAEYIKTAFSTQDFTNRTGMRTEYRGYKLYDKISGFSSAIEILEFGQVEDGVRAKIRENLFLMRKTASVNETEAVKHSEEINPIINNQTENSADKNSSSEDNPIKDDSKELNQETNVKDNNEIDNDNSQEKSPETSEISETSEDEEAGIGGFLLIMMIVVLAFVVFGLFGELFF